MVLFNRFKSGPGRLSSVSGQTNDSGDLVVVMAAVMGCSCSLSDFWFGSGSIDLSFRFELTRETHE
ncbi:hypothetical protein HanXRQr2_Chr06g0276431 [Helianthus annuus]|uniref:Uncharacterized protein n=1 Tax=Helianthus annuus TaxID=4232 RepID=A0A251UJV6_HELAN|nr:hypothetical protein HanXRQr2_Chr06g0276431 [Helianthus annuus]KAJ0561769.1 hypothetical protein HanHA300_Chr06g0226711 [Helianthus annuus]KAJ0568529.1 hypothetical protein HanIR_Chr06g0297241 [Helianthus annuus]KAJ0574833.1 hypothetical protein HanHA89_Chr06g0242661 [Helianthus annuus]KAJ0916916.1 hypothetical protein HanPSC8_Chr06g0267291 [Helianthus annuus]